MPRYASFPEQCTWFVSVGAFPADNDGGGEDGGRTHARVNKHVRLNRGTGRAELVNPVAAGHGGAAFDPVQNCSTDPTDCYAAGIVKTTDCGKTWATVFKNVNTGDHFYPNGLDCATADDCVARKKAVKQ